MKTSSPLLILFTLLASGLSPAAQADVPAGEADAPAVEKSVTLQVVSARGGKALENAVVWIQGNQRNVARKITNAEGLASFTYTELERLTDTGGRCPKIQEPVCSTEPNGMPICVGGNPPLCGPTYDPEPITIKVKHSDYCPMAAEARELQPDNQPENRGSATFFFPFWAVEWENSDVPPQFTVRLESPALIGGCK